MVTVNRSENQAKAQMESIKCMVERLEHAQAFSCDGEAVCPLNPSTLAEFEGTFYEYHDLEAAQQAILESPLSVLLRSSWTIPGHTLVPAEFEILLCTGGPAVRIRGELGNNGEPTQAHMEYQDWLTPWESFFGEDICRDEVDLLVYASQFYFGW